MIDFRKLQAFFNTFIKQTYSSDISTDVLKVTFDRRLIFFVLVLGISLAQPSISEAAHHYLGYVQVGEGDELLQHLDDPEQLRLMVILLVIFALLSLFGMLYVVNTNKILQSNNKLIIEQKNKISDQKDALEFQNETLEELNIEKNNMLSVVAHDLKVPLGNIQGLVGLMYLQKDNLTPEQVEYLDLIKKVSFDGSSMVDNMLNVHKIEAELQKMTLARYDILQIIENVVKAQRTSADSKHVGIEVLCDKDEVFIETDKQYFHQIISNLLSNAIKFSPEGSLIEISVEDSNSSIHVNVKDEGPGMNPSDQKRIFTGYQKITGSNGEEFKSTGFGLAIVSKLSEKLGAKINVDSVQGEGTTIGIEVRKSAQD